MGRCRRKRLLVNSKQKIHSASTMNHTNLCFYVEDDLLIIPVVIARLLYVTPLHPKLKIKHHTSCNWKFIVS